MFRPQIQKTRTLVAIAIFNVGLVWWSVNSKTKLSDEYTLAPKDKINAVTNMRNAVDALRDHPNFRISKGDIYETGLIGVSTSKITTKQDDGDIMLASKLACSHPNFAAQMVVYLLEAGLKSGDTVAVGMTGSFPGANIAMLSACKALGIKTVSISSIGSSAWGANRLDFTWPHIENYLYKLKLIDSPSIAYSIGGKNDVGIGQDDGFNIDVNEIKKVANNFDINLIEIPLKEDNLNVKARLDYYKISDVDFAAYINIGGGVASLGYNKELLIQEDEIDEIEESNKEQLVGVLNYGLEVEEYDLADWENSVAYEFFKKNIPVINIRNIPQLLLETNLYPANVEVKDLEGDLFTGYKSYNIYVIIVSLFLSLLVIISIGIYSHIQIKRRMESYD